MANWQQGGGGLCKVGPVYNEAHCIARGLNLSRGLNPKAPTLTADANHGDDDCTCCIAAIFCAVQNTITMGIMKLERTFKIFRRTNFYNV